MGVLSAGRCARHSLWVCCLLVGALDTLCGCADRLFGLPEATKARSEQIASFGSLNETRTKKNSYKPAAPRPAHVEVVVLKLLSVLCVLDVVTLCCVCWM